MLNLVFAPSADILVPLAVESIRQAWGDPFDPPAIVVPNPAVGKWLKIRLAGPRAFGCVANARLVTLERFLWEILGGGQGMELIRAEHLSQIVCAALNDDVLNDDAYAPLKNYLCGPPAPDEPRASKRRPLQIDALKRAQLSMKIASQFLEYEYNRPSVWIDGAGKWKHGIDAKWLRGERYYDGDGHEAWQMDLYRRVNERFRNGGLISLPHLYRRRREERAKERLPWCDVGSNRRIILFGVSKISHFHRNALVEISQIDGVDMRVFLTNPCAEFWEDVDTSRGAFRRKWRHDSPESVAGIRPVRPDDYEKSELDMFAYEENHPLLGSWGRAGQENIILWCPQAHWNFEYYCGGVDGSEPVYPGAGRFGTGDSESAQSSDTLLKTIQKTLLLRKNDLDNTSDKLKNDGSIRILACPDASREVEELREMILDAAHEKRVDNFNDIAVYIPDTNKYLPHIQRVFGAYPRNHSEHIPFTILGASRGSSLAARALFALLDIVDGQFNRARIFELLRNPIVRASREISPDDVETWENWAEEFGMFRGYDAGQRRSMGDMGDAVTDEHTFGRGMERVLAGIDAAEGGAAATLADTEPSEERELAETFLSLLRELSELYARFAKSDSTLDIRESVQTLADAVWSWLGNIPNDNSVDCSAESRVRRDALDGLERILLQRELARRESMPADEFIALARGCIPEETAVPSNAWNGITFAPLKASMVLPHRVIFALGLGASDFPGVSESGSWNLLAGKRKAGGAEKKNRIVGDSDTVRDNRFAFLELIHAARDMLVLSYRARDMQRDERLQPSSVIMELEEYLIGQGLTDGEGGSRQSSIRREVPWVAHESLDGTVRKHGTWDRTQRELAVLASAARVRHRHELSARAKGAPAPDVDADPRGVSVRDIKTFFQNPLEYHLYRTLGIRDRGDDGDMLAVDEPVETGDRFLYRMRQKVWTALLNMIFSPDANSDGAPREIVDEAGKIYDEHVGLGRAPEGHVRRMEREALIKWAEECAARAPELRAYFPNHRFVERYEFDFECGPFVISGDLARIILPREPENPSLKIGVTAFARNGTPEPEDNGDLWIDWVAQSLHEIKSGGARGVTPVILGHDRTPDVRISPVNIDGEKSEEIENWLAGMLTQMRREKRSEHLPFRAVAELIRGGSTFDTLTFGAVKKYLSENPYKKYMDGFKLADAKPAAMSDEELRGVARFRYAPIIERRFRA